MKNLKKIMTLLLAVVMVTGLLAGCGKAEQKEEAAPAQKEEVKEEVKEEAPAEEELEYVKLKFIGVGDSQTKAEEVFVETVNKMLLEDLNCEIEFQGLTWAEHVDKYPLILASGEDWDCIFTASWKDYPGNSRKGAYMELTEEMFQTYMPMTYEASKGAKLDSVRIDGKIYMVPQTAPDYFNADYWAVRGDIMTEAGIDDITSSAELAEYFDYVVANRPEMNVVNITAFDNGTWGSTVGATLLFDEDPSIAFLSGQFVCEEYHINKVYTGYRAIDASDYKDLKWVDEAITDAAKIKLYNKNRECMEKGYWAADCLSVSNALETYYLTGDGASAMRQISGPASWVGTLRRDMPEADARMVRVLDTPMYAPPSTSSGAAINPNSKNPERTMMVCDLFGYDQEYVDLLQHGIEGVHFTLNDDGTMNKVAEPEYVWEVSLFRSFLTTATRIDATRIPEFKEFEDVYGAKNAITPMHMTYSFDRSAWENEYAACNEVATRYNPILDTGMSADVEATYAEYKEALDNAGYRELSEAYLEGMKEWAAASGL